MDVDAQQAVTKLFEEYGDSIYRYASYSLPQHFDARDVVQEVFLRAYRAWGNFRGDSNEKTWLFQIARNYINDLLRKSRKEEKGNFDYSLVYRTRNNVLWSMVEYEELLNSLPLKYRQVLVLRAMEGFSVQETANILSCSESSVRLTYFRAKRKFSKLLYDDSSVHLSSNKEGGNSL